METALLEKKSLVENFLTPSPCVLSSHSFVNIFAWKDFFEFEFKTIGKNLCIFAKSSLGCFMYLPPLGPSANQGVINECFEFMYGINGKKGITRIDNVSHQMLSLFPGQEFKFYKKGYEYCYYREEIASFRGNAFKSQRASYNKFIKNNNYKFLPYAPKMQQGCAELYGRWAKQRLDSHKDGVYQQLIEENALVHQQLLKFYQELDLIGRVVLIDGKIKAYTLGYPLTSDIFCVLLEITDLDVAGLSAFIFREFCKDEALKDFKFINVMDDLE